MKTWKTISPNLLNDRKRVKGIREICKRKWIQWRAERYIFKGVIDRNKEYEWDQIFDQIYD